MGMVRSATVVLMLIAVPVLAESVVTYQLELGGDNHADSIKGGTRVAYTRGLSADGEVYAAGVLNWATTIAVTGAHSQPGHPSDGLATQGVANFVMNLELRKDAADGTLMTGVTYHSTIHSGTGALTCADCAGGYVIPGPTEFCAGSAFAYAFDFVGWGPGTVLDAIALGSYTGPFMEVGMYPTVDVGNTSGDGQLLGVGAGYGQWSRGGSYDIRTTKGVGIPTAEGGLGILPVVEGQIDTSTLETGTYYLVLSPGAGHNVLRGDVDLVSAPAPGGTEVQAFAVPANHAYGDTIMFQVGEPLDPLALVKAESVKTHGTAGTYGIEFYPTEQAIECRWSNTAPTGAVTKVEVTFNRTIFCDGGSCDPADVGLYPMYSASAQIDSVQASENVLTLNLSGVTTTPDVLYFDFPGISDSQSNTVADLICIRVLRGDANASGGVSSQDMLAVRSKLNQVTSESNFKNDVNSSGSVTSSDLLDVRAQLNKNVSGC